MPRPFVHLHVHTTYSLLDGASHIDKLVAKAAEDGQPAVAISDHGNLYGVPQFVLACQKLGLQPIVGCEFYLAGQSRHEKATSKKEAEGRNATYHQILFAKSAVGYRNLMTLSSKAFTEGFHYKPRIDKALLAAHAEGLVATTCCLASEVNQAILRKPLEEAEALFRWYHELFGDDYYVELQDHNLADQKRCNQVLLGWAQKYNVKLIATNDVHYVDGADAEAHDLLLALQTGKNYKDEERFRFLDDQNRLNDRFYFKTADEMAALFPAHPEALENTLEIAAKCQFQPKLDAELILPVFQVPEGFADDNAYLRHLSFEGAQRIYGELRQEVTERLDHELAIIRQKGYASYFLIVQDFTNEARKRGVYVGPGRGSAAGSLVAYCVGIIDVDPLAYQLYFERFLNPERGSPPDIDIDFDDAGREEVIRFVVDKYGKESVAQIITYGTMGAKTAIRDVGRTLEIPLPKVDQIAKYVPDRPGMSFAKALSKNDNPDHYQDLKKAFDDDDPLVSKMMDFAQRLEGTPRHTGIHAAGVIIAPGRVSDYAPIATARNKDQTVITQYDGPMAELAGLLKMDFLGLKTLSIIKTCVRLIQQGKGVEINPDRIPLDDTKTFELYQRGDTVATFQFESDGMRKYLRQLRPTELEDLIAMNALYRPGPMDNIPSFVNRKHGREAVSYPHPLLEPSLKPTYGIMVYQEQIMEAARVLAGYTLGAADSLRRAMGKKKVEVMDKERAKFVAGAEKLNAIPAEQANEIFDLMAKFAGYGFNKSHAAAYSILAFRTAYLKAHYPQEYMAAVLSHNLDNTDKLTFFMEECQRMGIAVQPPDVNTSGVDFAVDPKGDIRFGLGAIKGVGRSVAEAITEARITGSSVPEAEAANPGPFAGPFDFARRVDHTRLSRKALEALADAGALDALFHPREQAWAPYNPNTGGAEVDGLVTDDGGDAKGERHVLDFVLAYARRHQEEHASAQQNMFGGSATTNESIDPVLPRVPENIRWSVLERLNRERDVIGFYLSGHPLDRFALEIRAHTTGALNELEQHRGKPVVLAGIVTAARERMTRRGERFGSYVVEDKSGKLEFALFRDDHAKFQGFLKVNNCVLLRGQYAPSRRDPAQFELRIASVQLLEGALERLTKVLRIELPLERLTPTLVEELDDLLSTPAHRGKAALRFDVRSENAPRTLVLASRSHTVQPTRELVQTLEGMGLVCTVG